MSPSMTPSNSNNAHGDSFATSPYASSPNDESSSQPPSLLCSSSSFTTPLSSQHDQAAAGDNNNEHVEEQQQQQLADQQDQQSVCDDTSYFDGDWVSSTVHSAVTHFFGSDKTTDDESQAQVANAALPIIGNASEQEEEEELTICMQQLSPTDNNTVTSENYHVIGGSSVVAFPNVAINTTNNNNGSNEQSLPLLSKARSLSPSFSLFASPSGCGIYTHLQCDTNPNNSTTHNNNNTDDIETSSIQPSLHYQPYFSPSDFSPQTWSNVLQDTSTIRYCGAGAAVLTAVIVIHPLALIGAAATAAVSATAMWAVGFFHDLDKGYQIWSEEFGMLFWEDHVESTTYNDGGGGAGGVAVNASPLDGRRSIAATVTSESNVIIQKDEEHLRRVFLLEQERRRRGEDEVTVVEVEEATGKVLREVMNDSSAGDEGVEEEETISSFSSKETKRLQQQKQPQPQKKQSYGLRRIRSAPVKVNSKSTNKSNSNQLLPLEKPPRTAIASVKPKIKNQQQSAAKKSTISSSTPQDTSSSTTTEMIDSHFPPLEICVVHQVELPGLNTAEFFKVFFADDAPYSMRDFQKKRGDVDIRYGKWKELEDDGEDLYSLKKGDGAIDPAPLPPNSTQERKLRFNTLTKSYFGPAYAKAIKTQRATQLSNHVLVIENVTQLVDIPFADRFRVIERWVVEAVKNNDAAAVVKQPSSAAEGDASGNKQSPNLQSQQQDGIMDDALYTCKLSVQAEVELLKSCSWEAQIRKKASETFTEVVTEWCKSATVALKATEEQKRKRLRQDSEGSGRRGSSGNNMDYAGNNNNKKNVGSNASKNSSTTSQKQLRLHPPMPPPETPSAKESELFAKHRRNFQELDKLIGKGDLEWCSIEVMHSTSNVAEGEEPALFAQVLEYPSTMVASSEIGGSSMTGSTDDYDGEMMDGSRRKATVMMRRKSRKLFKRLSSKVTKSKQPR